MLRCDMVEIKSVEVAMIFWRLPESRGTDSAMHALLLCRDAVQTLQSRPCCSLAVHCLPVCRALHPDSKTSNMYSSLSQSSIMFDNIGLSVPCICHRVRTMQRCSHLICISTLDGSATSRVRSHKVRTPWKL